MPTPTTVAEYLAAQPALTRAPLRRVRAAIRRALPGAEEVISYAIPALRLDGRVVIYFAGWKAHWSLYPFGEAVRAAFGEALEGLEFSKGTIRFPLDRPVPVGLVQRLARYRAAEVAERGGAKAAFRKKTTRSAGPGPRRSARAADRTEFMQSCARLRVSPALCECFLEELPTHFATYDAFQRNRDPAKDRTVELELERCARKHRAR